MQIFDKAFKEILSTQVISVIGGLIAGSILAIYTNKLLLIPGMLILLPGFLEMRGNISGALASRLSSGLFLGVIKPKETKSRIVRGNLWACLIEAVFVAAALGIIAFLFDYLILGVIAPKIILIPIIASVITDAVEIPLTIFVTFYLFRKGHDPNNIMGPFVTSTGDITSVAALLITMVIV